MLLLLMLLWDGLTVEGQGQLAVHHTAAVLLPSFHVVITHVGHIAGLVTVVVAVVVVVVVVEFVGVSIEGICTLQIIIKFQK